MKQLSILKPTLTILVFLQSFLAFSQNMTSDSPNTKIGDLMLMSSSPRNISMEYESIEGTPYLFEEFAIADVIFASGQVSTNVPVRMNMLEEKIEFMRGDKVFVLDKMEDVKQINFEDKSYQIFHTSLDGVLDYYLFEVLVQGECSLLKKNSVIFQDPKKPTNSYEQEQPAKFVWSKDDYYLVFPDEYPVEVTSKKKFGRYYEVNNPKLLEILERNRYNPLKLDDLILLANDFNSLYQ